MGKDDDKLTVKDELIIEKIIGGVSKKFYEKFKSTNDELVSLQKEIIRLSKYNGLRKKGSNLSKTIWVGVGVAVLGTITVSLLPMFLQFLADALK